MAQFHPADADEIDMPAEPARARRDDPLASARRALLRAVTEAAVIDCPADSVPTPLGGLRQALALELLERGTMDAAVLSLADQRATEQASEAAALPCATVAQVAAKLAFLVRELAQVTDDIGTPEELLRLKLASCALSDLVLIGDHPILLPDRACRPVISRADAQYWEDIAGHGV